MAIYSGFSRYTWWFSTVMLVYQRVTPFNQPRTFCISTVPFRRWWLAISLTHARAMWHTTIAAGITSPQAASGNLGLGSLGSLADVQFHVPSPLRMTRALWPDFYTKIGQILINWKNHKKSSRIRLENLKLLRPTRSGVVRPIFLRLICLIVVCPQVWQWELQGWLVIVWLL